ncbi:MAG: sulfatase-like hydrolase/transferase, partial [Phycisphaerales bacterium]
MRRRDFLKNVGSGTAGLVLGQFGLSINTLQSKPSSGAVSSGAAPAQPNILLIMADDVGCGPLGAYGGQRWKTPHIHALAKGGMRFDYCFSMPVCHPTRICLMTGKYPFRLNSDWGTFPQA